MLSESPIASAVGKCSGCMAKALSSWLLPHRMSTQQATREKLETAGFRVLVWQDTTAEARQAAQARARHVEGPPPVLGTHLIIGDD